MKVKILELLEGAKRAEGITVIIDVFRAFSLECYLYSLGAAGIYPVGDLQDARNLKLKFPDYILVGERGGKKCEGFDYGNSPAQIQDINFTGKHIIHTTSAGTQGIVNAVNADEVLTGSLVNAQAIAEYIRKRQPETVSLVAMGKGGIYTAKEDILCANYIKDLLLQREHDIDADIKRLRINGAEHFFDDKTQEIYPKEDFELCTKTNYFPFVIKIDKNEDGELISKMIKI